MAQGLRLYFGGGRSRVWGGRGGGEGVVGTFWLFNGHGSTDELEL